MNKRTRKCSISLVYEVVDLKGEGKEADLIHSVTTKAHSSAETKRGTGNTLEEALSNLLTGCLYTTLPAALEAGFKRKIKKSTWESDARELVKDASEWGFNLEGSGINEQ